MNNPLSTPRFLAVYSGVLTIIFVATVVMGISRGALSRRPAFDQITVHRINIVESDGIPRIIIADKAEFPGSYYHGKEIARADRSDSAGMLFINDEGTENGGLLIGGYKGKDGSLHSWGHLSFDEYEQDQTLDLDTMQDGADRQTSYRINDNGDGLLTPQAIEAFAKARKLPAAMPEELAARRQAMDAVIAEYGLAEHPRAALCRQGDKSVALRLKDVSGHDRIVLSAAANGTPSMEFLDAGGRITHSWLGK